MEDKFKITTYIAGPIEHLGSKEEMLKLRQELKEELRKDLKSPNIIGIYCPMEQEAQKVGKTSEDQCNYIKGLKKAGHWNIFHSEMWKIWFGLLDDNSDVIDVLKHLRMIKHVDGNRLSNFPYWGDAEAVVRSDFIIVYLPDTKTVGTYLEMSIAALFRIPIYLILPDQSKTDANSTLIFVTEKLSKGKVFYNIKDCCKSIKEDYNLK